MCQGCVNIDVHFSFLHHGLCIDHLKFARDLICNTSNDGSVDFETLGQPFEDEISHHHFWPYVCSNIADLGQHEEVVNADLGQLCSPSSRVLLGQLLHG